jgi:hypothetical protein
MLLASDFLHLNGSNNQLNTRSEMMAGSPTVNQYQQQPSDLMTNFRDLLIFWQSHYLQKDKDWVGLEQNSRIDFAYWKKTVELLLDTNSKNKCSLSFYLEKDVNYLASNKPRIDEYRSD